jgi:hypothetical protein
MEQESEKYRKVLSILRKSKPLLNSTEDIEREVIKRISKNTQSGLDFSGLADFMFGWVYIGWIRRSFIAASFVLVIVFVLQQGVILKQISYLGRQPIIINCEFTSRPAGEIEKKLMIYKLSGRRFSTRNITMSQKELNHLLESVNELQTEYKELMDLIEGDPELKEMVNKKMVENNYVKFKL